MANIILPVAQPWGRGPPRSGGGGAATSRHRPSVSASRCHLPIASRQGGSGSAPVQPALAKRLAMKKLALSLAAMLLPLSAAAATEPAEEPRALGVEASIVFPSDRSEEHTSELQSLMRTSYHVFCLKKTNETAPTIASIH